MDILGIKDPIETKSTEGLEADALEHFRETFSIDKISRYEIHLPWKETLEWFKWQQEHCRENMYFDIFET